MFWTTRIGVDFAAANTLRKIAARLDYVKDYEGKRIGNTTEFLEQLAEAYERDPDMVLEKLQPLLPKTQAPYPSGIPLQEESDAWGIYAIGNRVTRRVYVGMTGRPFRKRWQQHRKLLEANRHSNKALQEEWNSYGADMFEFLALEIMIDYKQIGCREGYWTRVYRHVLY